MALTILFIIIIFFTLDSKIKKQIVLTKIAVLLTTLNFSLGLLQHNWIAIMWLPSIVIWIYNLSLLQKLK